MQDCRVVAVGHRIVHGGTEFTEPTQIDSAKLESMKRLIPLAPLHQPHNIAGVEAALAAFPSAVQVGCFDTSFHRSHPLVADIFGLPKSFYEEGVRRYGFHGLSYSNLAPPRRDRPRSRGRPRRRRPLGKRRFALRFTQRPLDRTRP